MAYYHSDLIGTTRMMTNGTGQPTDEAVYTAFGEKISGNDYRYGYAGAYGYQSTIDDTTGSAVFPYLLVGHRYYDPALGRFLQRDPIGIAGGLNVYTYVLNRPTVGVDPTGKGIWSLIGGTIGTIVGGGLIHAALIAGTAPTWVAAVGAVIIVVSAIVVVNEIIDIWSSANRMVNPIRKGLKRRGQRIKNLAACAGMGMGTAGGGGGGFGGGGPDAGGPGGGGPGGGGPGSGGPGGGGPGSGGGGGWGGGGWW